MPQGRHPCCARHCQCCCALPVGCPPARCLPGGFWGENRGGTAAAVGARPRCGVGAAAGAWSRSAALRGLRGLGRAAPGPEQCVLLRPQAKLRQGWHSCGHGLHRLHSSVEKSSRFLACCPLPVPSHERATICLPEGTLLWSFLQSECVSSSPGWAFYMSLIKE